jgi:eukaryotic-like serine/threonine-protein kinase
LDELLVHPARDPVPPVPPVTGGEPGPRAGQFLGGRYRLDSLIAAGGMGEVWSATDELLGRPVAVKLVKGAHAADEAFLSRFRAEARFAAALSHPGIAQVFDYGEQDGSPHEQYGSPPRQPYLVMELVSGRQLSALIDQVGAMPTGVVLDIVGQVARALQQAHRIGITHRDIKPANLLISDDGVVKITDFGIASAVSPSRSPSGGTAGTRLVMGTAAYMSPEQAEGEPVAPASDIYSLGIVAYQCVAGRLPFTAAAPPALAVAGADSGPFPLPTGIPAGMRDLIMRMIAKDPRQRLASARDVAEATDLLRSELPGGGPRVADVAAWVDAGIGEPMTGTDSAGTTTVQPLAQSGRPSRRWRRTALAAALVCLVTAGASAAVATIMLTGSPAAVTRHSPGSRPVAQAPAPTPHATAHRSKPGKPSVIQVPVTSHSGTPRPAQPVRTISTSAPPSSSHSAPPRTDSPGPSPTPSPTPPPPPSPSPNPSPAKSS